MQYVLKSITTILSYSRINMIVLEQINKRFEESLKLKSLNTQEVHQIYNKNLKPK